MNSDIFALSAIALAAFPYIREIVDYLDPLQKVDEEYLHVGDFPYYRYRIVIFNCTARPYLCKNVSFLNETAPVYAMSARILEETHSPKPTQNETLALAPYELRELNYYFRGSSMEAKAKIKLPRYHYHLETLRKFLLG